MDKKKKKYIVLTIIAVLLIGLLILINVIGAGTKSASAESVIEYPTPQTTVRTTATEEYTDITQFAPSSEYKNYVIYRDFDTDNYKISWIQEANQGLLNNYDAITDLTNNGSNLDYNYNFAGEEPDIMAWFARSVNPSKQREGYISYFGEKITGSFSETISKQGNYLTSAISYGSLNDLFISMIKGTINYSPSNTINARFFVSDKITVGIIGAFQQEIYSNYNELNLTQIYVTSDSVHNYFLSDIPQDVSSRVVNLANELQENYNKGEENGFQSGYDKGKEDGYNEGTNRTWFGVFTDAVIEKIYKPNTWEDTSTDIIFTTYGISFDNAFAKIEEYRKTNQTPDTEAFYIQLKFSKPFKFQNDNDFYAKLYTNKKVMQSWFETETGRQIFITTDEEPNPNGFGYRIKTNEDLSEPITVQRLIICYTPYYKDTLASDFVDLGTGTNATEYNNGYVTGKNEGFENGYAQGKNDGYQNGYSAGLIEGQGPTTSIQKLIASVQAALNVDLFGSISLQDILNVMIAIFFVLIALKLFAGG